MKACPDESGLRVESRCGFAGSITLIGLRSSPLKGYAVEMPFCSCFLTLKAIYAECLLDRPFNAEGFQRWCSASIINGDQGEAPEPYQRADCHRESSYQPH